MNSLHFACLDCHIFIDAGYRWAYWTLQHPEIVAVGEMVNIDSVLRADEYWDGAANADWLAKLLPQVKRFLEIHKNHGLIYGEFENLFGIDHEHSAEWMEEEAVT